MENKRFRVNDSTPASDLSTPVFHTESMISIFRLISFILKQIFFFLNVFKTVRMIDEHDTENDGFPEDVILFR